MITITKVAQLDALPAVIHDGLCLKGLRHTTIMHPRMVTGGYRCLHLLDCVDVSIYDWRIGPANGAPDEDGNGPHLCELENCRDCLIADCQFFEDGNGEMGVGLFKSRDCEIVRNTFNGSSNRKSGDRITIDYGSVRCKVRNNIYRLYRLNSECRAVNVAWGKGHVVEQGEGFITGGLLDQPIAVDPCYALRGRAIDADHPAVPVTKTRIAWSDRKQVYIAKGCQVTFKKGRTV